MQNLEAKDFEAILGSTFEIFDRKTPSPAAVKLWFDLLKEFAYPDVYATLRFWAKTKNKAPTIAEIVAYLRDRASSFFEKTAAVDKDRRAREYVSLGQTQRGLECLAMVAQILRKPKLTPRQHWERVAATTGLALITYEAARRFLKKGKTREPGEDDERAAA